MEDSEPQLRQAWRFCIITLRRHHARSPEGYTYAAYHAAYPSAFRSPPCPSCSILRERHFYEVG
jgi:hypothetical protein